MEFIALVGLVAALGAALVILAVTGNDDGQTATSMRDAFKVLLGTVGGLVWAARSVVASRKPRDASITDDDADGAPRG